MLEDFFKLSFLNLKKRGLRSWLTMIGIFIGIAAVVSLISLGNGLKSAVSEQFESIGTDKITISPGTSLLASMGGTGIELKERDFKAVKKVKGIELVTGFIYKVVRVKHGDTTKYSWVIGLPTNPEDLRLMESVQSWSIKDGRNLKGEDKYKALVGYNLGYDEFLGRNLKIGDSLEIENQEFKIVGIISRIGNDQDDSQLLIPMDTARDLFDEPEKYDFIFAQVKKGADVDAIAEDVKKELRNYRDVEENEEDFSVETSQDLINSFNIILTIIQYIVIGIAAISLVVGGIGIMNTMYTSVLERTKEIGLMKAVGARNNQVLLLFLIESGMLGLAGGVIGAILGIAFSQFVEFITVNIIGFAYLDVKIDFVLVAGVLLFSFLVGCISGLMPARRAANLRPVNALRYE